PRPSHARPRPRQVVAELRGRRHADPRGPHRRRNPPRTSPATPRAVQRLARLRTRSMTSADPRNPTTSTAWTPPIASITAGRDPTVHDPANDHPKHPRP